MEKLTVTIMAAGEGKRMNSNIPKVLHNFHGVPMLIRIVLEVIKINPTKIIIITGKYDTLIKTTIKEYCVNNLSHFYDKLIFIQQDVPNGTGGAIKCTLDLYSNNENVLILNGDMPLLSASLIEKFLAKKSNAKLLVSQLDNPYGYGRILYDENNNFIGIREEKDCNEYEKRINIVNVGIYLFNSQLLKTYIPMIDNNNVQQEYYLTDIVKIIKNNLSLDIDTYMIEEEYRYQIYGVNTKEELALLESQFC